MTDPRPTVTVTASAPADWRAEDGDAQTIRLFLPTPDSLPARARARAQIQLTESTGDVEQVCRRIAALPQQPDVRREVRTAAWSATAVEVSEVRIFGGQRQVISGYHAILLGAVPRTGGDVHLQLWSGDLTMLAAVPHIGASIAASIEVTSP